MPKYAPQSQWRSRRNAIGKKAELDIELLQENETVIMSKKQPIEAPNPALSPISIFSIPELMPEMKPITLPGAWVTVGKRGKPIVNTKMYDQPAPPKKKKRARKEKAAPESIWALEEAPSSSKCLQILHQETMRHKKTATRGRDAKYWARYRQQHDLKLHARDALLAEILFSGSSDDMETSFSQTMKPLKMRDNKKNSNRERARRHARDAKYEDAFWPEELHDSAFTSIAIPVDDDIKPPTMTAPRAAKAKQPVPARWWQVVGKNGKAIKIEKPGRRTTRPRKEKAAAESIWALEVMPAASKCLQALHDDTARHEKASSHGKTTKFWKQYQAQKQRKIHARDTLQASLDDEADAVPPSLKMRDNTKNSNREKARRHARDAKDQHRCYWPEERSGWPRSMLVNVAAKSKKTCPAAHAHSTKTLSPASPFVLITPPSDGCGNVSLPASLSFVEEAAFVNGKHGKKKKSCVIS